MMIAGLLVVGVCYLTRHLLTAPSRPRSSTAESPASNHLIDSHSTTWTTLDDLQLNRFLDEFSP
jgi:hypothetical protein